MFKCYFSPQLCYLPTFEIFCNRFNGLPMLKGLFCKYVLLIQPCFQYQIFISGKEIVEIKCINIHMYFYIVTGYDMEIFRYGKDKSRIYETF